MSTFDNMDKSDREVVPNFQLDGYLKRIGLDTSDVLKSKRDKDLIVRIVMGHLEHIPYENLDCVLGRGVDLTKVYDKLVTQKRGGFCFEQNSLMYSVLKELGFSIERRMCRVIVADPHTPYTHITLIVSLVEDGVNVNYLVDVGFGKGSPPGVLKPDVLNECQVINQHAYRIVPDNGELVAPGGFVLQGYNYGRYYSDVEDGEYDGNSPYECEKYWLPLYVCDYTSPVFDSQLTMAAYYSSHYMGSANWFTRKPVCVSRWATGRKVLNQNVFSMYEITEQQAVNGTDILPVEKLVLKRECQNIQELCDVLLEYFGMQLHWDHRRQDSDGSSEIFVPKEAEFNFTS